VYELTPQAEELFPKAYEPVLHRLVDVMTERLGNEETEVLLRAVGRRMAEGRIVPADGLDARLQAAVVALNELGGLVELEERDGNFIIRGYSCPLAALVSDHPEICRMVETLLTELVGVPVYESCDRGERACCCFETAIGDDTTQR
jgi:predicted ArsR family transcriptional regulator